MSERTDRARAKLLELAPPDKGCDRKTYRAHVSAWLAGSTVSMTDLSDMAALFVCGVEELADKIVRDQLGKG
ncbi:MAG: hypothetical protein GXY19_15975 [Phycisphaerae bacterium]|nr:hypothetical protein [Phycisphaerae bacterium]